MTGNSTGVIETSGPALLALGADDEGNAQAVKLLYGDKIRYVPAYGWLWYTGTHWTRELGEAKVNRAIIETFKIRGRLAFGAATQDDPQKALITASRLSVRNKNACRAQLQDILVADVDIFDGDPDLLNCANGALDLRTGGLQPHRADQYFTYCLAVPYDPYAKSATWDGFLAGVVGDDETRDFLQMAAGYSLTGHTREEVFFYVKGPTRSGKGTYTETFLHLLGYPLATEADFETFTAPRDGDTQNFDLAGLKPCRFVAASESQRYRKLNAAKIKQATGNNMIRCAFKGQDLFTYWPHFKIWLSSNFPANIDPEDDAAWARVRVIQFPHSHLGKEDKMLKHRLRSDDVLPAVLAWAAEGARRWYESPDGLQAPPAVMEAGREDREAVDLVGQFVDEHYVLIADEKKTDEMEAWLPTASVYATYKEWAEGEGHPTKFQGNLTKALKAKGFRTGRKYIAKESTRCIVGIRELTDDEKKEPEEPEAAGAMEALFT